MPTYDYVCDACNHEFEAFQSMKEATLTECPNCKELKLRRKIGMGAGIIFKGTGFYETDYKRKSNGSNGKAESKSSSDSSAATSSSETKSTESKSASKEPAKSTS